jgi:hypothetical protein
MTLDLIKNIKNIEGRTSNIGSMTLDLIKNIEGRTSNIGSMTLDLIKNIKNIERQISAQ